MANSANEDNWAARSRLRHIEFVLWWRSWVGRSDLANTFSTSAAQCSGDLQRYMVINPGAMEYNLSEKRYESSNHFVCKMHQPCLEEAIRVFLGGGPGLPDLGTQASNDPRLAVLALPERRPNATICRRIMVALLNTQRVRIRYHSLSSGEIKWRIVLPTGIAWDGQRWHIRAWCSTRRAWRDFVLGRCLAADWPAEHVRRVPADPDWHEIETLRLKINPKLKPGQIDALRMDHGLESDILEIPVRKAMRPYVLSRFQIDDETLRSAPQHFVLDS
jgi:hypothetical protein